MAEETAKLVDGAYKNILEKFNPSARHLVSAGKAYLKALHGVVAASKAYVDALGKLARHAHQGTWGGCADIGTALVQLVDVQKEIESQQLNILKAFYVDLIVPLESNIDKDAKIVACEQKKFLQQHKCLQDSYLKAVANVRKQKKKSRSSKINLDKEIKSMEILDQEKMKLDCFSERSLKQAIIQERRRFGFVLERQCSLTKHNLVYYTQGQNLLHHRLEEWEGVAKGRESLPEPIDKLFPPTNEFRSCNEYSSGLLLSDSSLSLSGSGTLRKTRSIDTSCMDLRDAPSDPFPRNLVRAKSDFNIASSSVSLASNEYAGYQGVSLRPKSLLVEGAPDFARSTVRALYSYVSGGEHQLSFHGGDVIALIGNRKKGWQYGENTRNQRCGWFPIAYTEPMDDAEYDSFDKSMSEPQHESLDVNHPYLKPPVIRSITAPAFHSYEWGIDSTYASAASSPLSGDGSISHVSAIPRPFSTFVDTDRATVESLQRYKEFRFDEKLQHASPHSADGSIAASTTPTFPAGASMTLDSMQKPRCQVPTHSLHGSSDSGFCNDGSSTSACRIPSITTNSCLPVGTEELYCEAKELEPMENIFSTVKLRKVVTNDRSAPMLS